MQKTTEQPGLLCLSGDGGTRTRVRKIRSSNLYEYSRSLVSLLLVLPTDQSASQPLGPESPLSCRSQQTARQLRLCVAQPTTGQRAVQVDVATVGH